MERSEHKLLCELILSEAKIFMSRAKSRGFSMEFIPSVAEGLEEYFGEVEGSHRD